MIKKWIPGILCGGLLAGSVIAFAASDDQALPSLSSVYNLAVANELPPRDVTLAYVHALVAQRKMELTKAHVDFVKQEVKAASGSVFHHADEATQESAEGSVDLTQADYFAAQAEYQANLQYLNQLVGKAYDQVQALKNDAVVANLDPQLKERYEHMVDETQQLKSVEVAYAAGQVAAQLLIQKEQELYTAQQEYWNGVQTYLTREIKTNGAPAVIADLQEVPVSLPQNQLPTVKIAEKYRPKQLVTNKAPQQIKKIAAKEIMRPRKLATQAITKKESVVKTTETSLFASLDTTTWTGAEPYHVYILPAPTSTVKLTLGELTLPAPQSTQV